MEDNEELCPKAGVGTYGRYLIPVLSLIYSNREYEKIYRKIDKWASVFGLNKFSAGWKGGLALGSDYVDNRLDVVLNLAMASHGSKQILSVITQLFWSDPGSIIMIEEPEISLHPDSQAHLAELFAEAIREDKQIIITTHSEFLPLTLSIPIQKGLLKIDDIAVYHVEKKQKGTIIKRLELTSKGYVKNWIPSFAELEERLLRDWIKTVPEE
ncbi:MAG: AAA family ATPase [Candidatus Methanoperedens sp.]